MPSCKRWGSSTITPSIASDTNVSGRQIVIVWAVPADTREKENIIRVDYGARE